MVAIRNDETGIPFGIAMAVLAVLLGLAGCDTGPDPAASTSQAKTTRKSPEAEMVSAVSTASGQALVDLKFELGGKPTVGEPLEIRLMLIPAQELELILARFQGNEAIELVEGAQTPQLERPAARTGIPHTLRVVPRHEGVSYITATVVADSVEQSTARQYSIPVIAGPGTTIAAPPAAQQSPATP